VLGQAYVFSVLQRTVTPTVSSAPGRIRTCDTRFRKPLLSPLSYEGPATPLPPSGESDDATESDPPEPVAGTREPAAIAPAAPPRRGDGVR
jgi:hypothetical protein